MARNKHKYNPTIYYSKNNIQGYIQKSINKGLHNKNIVHDKTNIEKFKGTKNSRTSTIYNKHKPKVRVNNDRTNYVMNLIEDEVNRRVKEKRNQIKNEETDKLELEKSKKIEQNRLEKANKKLEKLNKNEEKGLKQGKKALELEKKAQEKYIKEIEKAKRKEINNLRRKAKAILKRAEEKEKLELFKEVYGAELDVKTIINNEEDFLTLKEVSKNISTIYKKQKEIDKLKPIIYNEDNLSKDDIKEKEKAKKKQERKIEDIKADIIEERKKQKEEATKIANADSLNIYRENNPEDEMYIRVKDINDTEQLEDILDSIRSKTYSERLKEKTYKDVYDFLTKRYFNEILHSRERLADGSPHELNVKERLEVIANSFGSDYAKAQDFLNELISTSFKGEYDSGEKKYNIVGFRAEMFSRLNRAEEKALMLNNK